ncbi:MAG: uridine diphosphate-N-acetylglucosamine-binding protein YvcK [Pseudoramibacter sp.]
MEIKEYIREFTIKDIVRVRNPRVVAFGGGTGLSVILRGLKKYTDRLTAVVTVGDDGGSSGKLREDLGILPPGDIRNCILALADDENVMQALFSYRFDKGRLKGHNFGNLFLAAMTGISSDFYDAIRRTSDVLQITGTVLPVTLDDMTLVGTLADGEVVEGESKIPVAAREAGTHIKRISLKTPAKALPETLDAIKAADIIIMGPGSLYTSVIPHLLVDGIEETIKTSGAKKFYVGNIMMQPGETIGYTQADHIRALEAHQKIKNKGPLFDYAVVNDGALSKDMLKRYASIGSKPVQIGEELYPYHYIKDHFVIQKNKRVRHDADLLAKRIFEVYMGDRKKTTV